jgi:hypothetical protein
MIIFVGQFTSLFLSAFLYAFKYGDTKGQTLPQINLTETITLAAITALFNIPFMMFFVKLMNSAGIDEFKWRYPLLYDELLRRHAFENELSKIDTDSLDLKQIDLNELRKNKNESNNTEINNTEIKTGINNTKLKLNNSNSTDDIIRDDENNNIYNLILIYLCSRKKTEKNKTGTIENAYQCANRKYPETIKKPSYYSYFPFHTLNGGLVFFLSIGWFIWCLNYLLLFAAHNEIEVSNQMLTTFGISEVSTILITQPITLFFLLGLAYLVNKLSKKYKFLKERNVPSLHYFSDPYIEAHSTVLSTSFAYNIFLYCPSLISGSSSKVSDITIKSLGYTTLNGVIEAFDSQDYVYSDRDKNMLVLYETLKNPESCNLFTNVILINDIDKFNNEKPTLIKTVSYENLNLYKVYKTVRIDRSNIKFNK